MHSRMRCYGQDGRGEGLQRFGAAGRWNCGLRVRQQGCRCGYLWPGGQGGRFLNAESWSANQGGLSRCQGQRLSCRGEWGWWGQRLRGVGHHWNRNDSQWGGGGERWRGCWRGRRGGQRQGRRLHAGFLQGQGMGQPSQAAGLLLLLLSLPLQAKSFLFLYVEREHRGVSGRLTVLDPSFICPLTKPSSGPVPTSGR